METIEERAKAISEGYDDDGYSAGLSLIENYKSQLREDVYVRLKKQALRRAGMTELTNSFKI